MGFRVMGTGSFLPENLMTNEDFEKIIDTSDEWIVKRTGIKRRHYVSEGEWNVDMSVAAAKLAMEQAGVGKDEIGGIIVGTVTNEMGVPSLASQVQRALGIARCVAFDVNAACSGYLYALKAAERFMDADSKPYLVIGSETLSRFMNMEDRGSCILFGDGAGAAVVCPGDNLRYFQIYSMPDVDHTIEITGMNTKENGTIVPSIVSLKGRDVYVFATREMERVIREGLEKTGLSSDDVALFVLHQANLRIVQTTAQRLGLPMDKFYVNIEDVANISAASIPISLDHANRGGKLKAGDKIVIAGVGGGLTSGCAIYEW